MKKRFLYLLTGLTLVICTFFAFAICSSAQELPEAALLSDDYESWIEFDTISDLLNAVSDGGEYSHYYDVTIRILKDITFNSPIVFSDSRAYSIWLDRHTLNADLPSSDKGLFYIENCTTFTLANSYYNDDDSDAKGVIEVTGGAAVYVGGTNQSNVLLDIDDIKLIGENAIYIDEISDNSHLLSSISISSNSYIEGTAGPAIVSVDIDPTFLPILTLYGGEYVSPDGCYDVETLAYVNLAQDFDTPTYIKTPYFPTVLDYEFEFTNATFVAASDITVTSNMLPYGYEMTFGGGLSTLEFDDNGEMTLVANDEFTVSRMQGYGYLNLINYYSDNAYRFYLDEELYHYTVLYNETVYIRIFPYDGLTADDFSINLFTYSYEDLPYDLQVTSFDEREVYEISFTMPTESVYLYIEEPTYDPLYTITKIPSEFGGDFTIDLTEAHYLDFVTVSILPEDGYVFKSVSMIVDGEKHPLTTYCDFYYANAEKTQIIAPADIVFSMPDEDIEITVEYIEGVHVYFRAPETEQWSETAKLIYKVAGDNRYTAAIGDIVYCEYKMLYAYFVPAEAESFFFQNYLTGTPMNLIPVGPIWSVWNTPEANRVYDFVEASDNPYNQPNDDSDTPPAPTPTPDDGTEGGDTPSEPTTPPTTEGDVSGGTSGGNNDGGNAGSEAEPIPKPDTTPDTEPDQIPAGQPDEPLDNPLKNLFDKVVSHRYFPYLVYVAVGIVCAALWLYLFIKYRKDLLDIFRD